MKIQQINRGAVLRVEVRFKMVTTKRTAKTAGGHSSFKGLIVEESYECILSFLCIMN